MKPTGKTRLRHGRTWYGKAVLILQLEYEYVTMDDPQYAAYREYKHSVWKDATIDCVSETFADSLVRA